VNMEEAVRWPKRREESKSEWISCRLEHIGTRCLPERY
jgi:hypothetical protein